MYRQCMGIRTSPQRSTLQWLAGRIGHLSPRIITAFSGIWMLMEGRILNHKVVKPYRTQKIKVLRAQNASVDLDGRILDRHFPLDIGVLHEAITLIIPN